MFQTCIYYLIEKCLYFYTTVNFLKHNWDLRDARLQNIVDYRMNVAKLVEVRLKHKLH